MRRHPFDWFLLYLWPDQTCRYCGCPFWTWRPWSRWHCARPHCQHAGGRVGLRKLV